MRKIAKTDENQPAIVEALRKAGCSVAITAQVGGGFPDLVVGYMGFNYLMEANTHFGKHTPEQIAFIENWKGQICTVRSVEMALEIIGR
jgi:hypothetical protein